MHRVTHYRRADDGIEAISLDTDRAFPRHAHDEFGVGVIVSGAHRSWSGCGTVDARAGDTIMVNPGEVHDGLPLGARAARSWRMLYLTPALVAGFAAEEGCGGVELAHPAVRDARLAAAVERLFARVVAGARRAPGARPRSGSRASGSTRRRPMPCRSPSSRVWRASAVFNCCAVSRASSASRRTPI